MLARMGWRDQTPRWQGSYHKSDRMKNLNRALRMTLKYRWSLMTSLVCSLLVAFLWSLNLSAVYPFVEIVLRGSTLHQWADEQQASCQELIEQKKVTVAELENQLAAGDQAEGQLRQELSKNRQEIATQQTKLAGI